MIFQAMFRVTVRTALARNKEWRSESVQKSEQRNRVKKVKIGINSLFRTKANLKEMDQEPSRPISY